MLLNSMANGVFEKVTYSSSPLKDKKSPVCVPSAKTRFEIVLLYYDIYVHRRWFSRLYTIFIFCDICGFVFLLCKHNVGMNDKIMHALQENMYNKYGYD